MSLKVGELAKRTGLTVRTLHHYDNIGLLTPSARSDSGYRLYQRDDIARLHQIQALRRFGLSLADIGTFLSRPDKPVSEIVARQIAALERQIEQATTLRSQLSQLQQQLKHGIEPGLADWLSTLELMTMYDNYFTKEEMARLPYFNAESPQRQEWRTLVAQAAALMASNTPPDDAAARKLAHQWLLMSERDTAGDADLALRLGAMLRQEASAREESGITPAACFR
jgi:DNA-binding transcriptional MerR regulator